MNSRWPDHTASVSSFSSRQNLLPTEHGQHYCGFNTITNQNSRDVDMICIHSVIKP